jgi:[protein-PII] uridylyltransferase
MIRAEAERFSDTESLDMLYLLTWADMNATQTKPPSRWKCQLLDTLYQRLREEVENRGQGPENALLRTMESPRKFRDQLATRIGKEAAERHIEGMPRRYSLMYDIDEAASHARLADALGDAPLSVDIGGSGSHARVVVYTHDRHYLLSDICGVLAVNDLNILYADAYTRRDGIIVDVFGVESTTHEDIDSASVVSELRATFLDVWAGKAAVPDLIRQHRRRWSRRKTPVGPDPPHVVIDDAVSEVNTVIDVFALDRIGLLHDLSRAISQCGLDIHMARIGTDGDRVADAFYVTEPDGSKLVDAERGESVRQAILDAIQGERT